MAGQKSNKYSIFFLTVLTVVVLAFAVSAQQQTPNAYMDVAYAMGKPNPAQTLDIIVPRSSNHHPLPLIIWIHGGAWLMGDKVPNPIAAFAERGFVVASINYRFSDEAPFPAQADDCKAAIRYLRENASKYNIDPERIGLFGSSAGGHLVALMGLSDKSKDFDKASISPQISARVQAVCDWCGISDFTTIGKQVNHNRPMDDAVEKLLGGNLKKKIDLAVQASPITYVSANAPPMLIMHGDNDRTVPYEQCVELYDALKKAGADVQLVTLKGAGHQFGNPQTVAQALAFFQEKLKH